MVDNEWLEHRKKGVGASDAPIIMGVSPYMTLYGLWEIKTSRAKNYEGNWATRRGNNMEPIARAHYELLTGRAMPAVLAQHFSIPWLRASLDGYNAEAGVVLEIKCPGKKDHALAMEGYIPEKYYPQCQHQLFVTGASRVDYFSFDGVDGVIVNVFPDIDYLGGYLMKAKQFWDYVLADTPPPLSIRDWKLIRSKALRLALDEWHSASLTNLAYAAELKHLIFNRDELNGKFRARCGIYKLDCEQKTIEVETLS